MNQTTQMKDFTVQKARPLPVILLADVSGSMSVEGKIDALNQAVKEMIISFAQAEELRAEIHVSVIIFGGTARLLLPLTPASEVTWEPMSASGGTPLGEALTLAAGLFEDKEQIPSRAYRPTVLLVSDGMPTDAWEEPMRRFIHEGRAKKADRMAMAIGADAVETMLAKFLNDPEKQVFHAEDAAKIRDFFRFVTMSVVTRSRSNNPNQPPPPPADPADLLEF